MKGFAKFLLIAVGVVVLSCFVLALVVPKTPKTTAPRLAVTIYAPQPTAALTFTPEPPSTATPEPTLTPTIEPTIEGQPLTEAQYAARMNETGARGIAQINRLDELRNEADTVEVRLKLGLVAMSLHLLAEDFRNAVPPPRYTAAHAQVLVLADSMDECAGLLGNHDYRGAYAQIETIGINARAVAAEFEKVE